ncbi:MAG TPA: hypothetical protein VNX25_01665 [Verrucomicrobiae bacterium]|nr:hypothetical protein [Verrucomicrobiae bacterium]
MCHLQTITGACTSRISAHRRTALPVLAVALVVGTAATANQESGFDAPRRVLVERRLADMQREALEEERRGLSIYFAVAPPAPVRVASSYPHPSSPGLPPEIP